MTIHQNQHKQRQTQTMPSFLIFRLNHYRRQWKCANAKNEIYKILFILCILSLIQSKQTDASKMKRNFIEFRLLLKFSLDYLTRKMSAPRSYSMVCVFAHSPAFKYDTMLINYWSQKGAPVSIYFVVFFCCLFPFLLQLVRPSKRIHSFCFCFSCFFLFSQWSHVWVSQFDDARACWKWSRREEKTFIENRMNRALCVCVINALILSIKCARIFRVVFLSFLFLVFVAFLFIDILLLIACSMNEEKYREKKTTDILTKTKLFGILFFFSHSNSFDSRLSFVALFISSFLIREQELA